MDILNTDHLPQQFDVMVSNPPYVRELEKTAIKKNVLQNEPHLALFVENDNPLLFYKKIADLAKKYLNKNGVLFFEINQYLGQETVKMLEKKGFTNIELRKDLFGNYRMIQCNINL
jgi:release factor glutamine methyltransferase